MFACVYVSQVCQPNSVYQTAEYDDAYESHKRTALPKHCDSSDRIATHYRLDGPEIESRWGQGFSTPVQSGPGAHTASCTMVIRSLPQR